MRVCVMDVRCRIRDLKQMKAFGNDIDYVFCGFSGDKINMNYLPNVKFYKVTNATELKKVVKKESIDVLHTHNYPDTYGNWGLEIKKSTGVPVVHEVHDMAYENASRESINLEKKVLKNVDGIISVSNGMRKLIKKKHGRNSTIIYAYPPKAFLPEPRKTNKFKRCIYQGGIRNTSTAGGKYNHRYYYNIFKKLASQGISIDIYPASPMSGRSYPGVNFRKYIKGIPKLYRTIASYDFAFVGYNKTNSGVMDIAAPNKMFESWASGVPTIVIDYKNLERLVKQTGCGVLVNKDTLSLPLQFQKKMMKAKETVMKNRMEFVMEKQKKKMLNLYRSVI